MGMEVPLTRPSALTPVTPNERLACFTEIAPEAVLPDVEKVVGVTIPVLSLFIGNIWCIRINTGCVARASQGNLTPAKGCQHPDELITIKRHCANLVLEHL